MAKMTAGIGFCGNGYSTVDFEGGVLLEVNISAPDNGKSTIDLTELSRKRLKAGKGRGLWFELRFDIQGGEFRVVIQPDVHSSISFHFHNGTSVVEAKPNKITHVVYKIDREPIIEVRDIEN